MFLLCLHKILCFFGYHLFDESEVSILYKADTKTMFEKKMRGWYNFRQCSECGKMQQQRVIMGLGEVKKVHKWESLTPHGRREYKRYKKIINEK